MIIMLPIKRQYGHWGNVPSTEFITLSACVISHRVPLSNQHPLCPQELPLVVGYLDV
jgi:hypothetical protein